MSTVAAATDAHNVHQHEGKRETILVQGRRFQIVGKLGDGAYSIVYLVQDPERNKRYALKRMAVQREQDVPKLVEEMEQTQRLSHHPFICACYLFEVARVEGKHYASMLLQHGGTPLVTLMQERQAAQSIAAHHHDHNQRFSETALHGGSGLGQSEVLRLAFQIGSAISFMHHQSPFPIAHRDIKAENIMEARGVFRLVDFGSSSTYAYEPRTSADFVKVQNAVASHTTMAYRAPEMCDVYRKHRIDEKVDVWALGVLIYFAMYFKLPFEETALSVLAGKVVFPTPAKNEGYDFDSECNVPAYDAQLIEAVKRCLVQNPAERWSVDDLLVFLGKAFPEEERAVKAIVEAMEDEEDPDMMKPAKRGEQVKLVAEGEMGRQPCAAGMGGSGGDSSDAGSPDSVDQPSWMAAKEEESTAAESSAPKKSGGGGGGGGGALFAKLKWNAGAAGSSPMNQASPHRNASSGSGIPPAMSASPVVSNSNIPQKTSNNTSSSVDDLFASSNIQAQKQHQPPPQGLFAVPMSSAKGPSEMGGVDLFGGSAPAKPQPHQQQQKSGGGGSIDIFGVESPTSVAAAAAAPKMHASSTVAQQTAEKEKKKDPFASLF